METFERYESEVRSYCRGFPAVVPHVEGQAVRGGNAEATLAAPRRAREVSS